MKSDLYVMCLTETRRDLLELKAHHSALMSGHSSSRPGLGMRPLRLWKYPL
jgi:hypothetical protein